MWYFNYGLQTPLSVTILRTKEKMGIGYPSVLAAMLNCHKKHSDYDPVLFSALSVDLVSVTVMYTLHYLRNLL